MPTFGELKAELEKMIPKELAYQFRKPKGDNGFHVLKNAFSTIEYKLIPSITDKMLKDKALAKKFLAKHSQSLNLLEKLTMLDYVLPKDHRFLVTNSLPNSSYMRFIFRLRALSLKHSNDPREYKKALQAVKFCKKYALQTESMMQTLVAIACQKIILSELQNKNLTDQAKALLNDVIINRNDIANAMRAEIKVSTHLFEMLSASPKASKLNLKNSYSFVIKDALKAIKYFEGNLQKQEFLKICKKHSLRIVNPHTISYKNDRSFADFVSGTFISLNVFKIENKLYKSP